MSRKCPHCGEQVGQLARSCWKCGGSLDVSHAGEVPPPVSGGEYRSPVTEDRGGPTGRQKAVGWMMIAVGVFMVIMIPLGIAVRGLPSEYSPALILAPFMGLAAIGYGISILRSKTSDINLFRRDLGRK